MANICTFLLFSFLPVWGGQEGEPALESEDTPPPIPAI